MLSSCWSTRYWQRSSQLAMASFYPLLINTYVGIQGLNFSVSMLAMSPALEISNSFCSRMNFVSASRAAVRRSSSDSCEGIICLQIPQDFNEFLRFIHVVAFICYFTFQTGRANIVSTLNKHSLLDYGLTFVYQRAVQPFS